MSCSGLPAAEHPQMHMLRRLGRPISCVAEAAVALVQVLGSHLAHPTAELQPLVASAIASASGQVHLCSSVSSRASATAQDLPCGFRAGCFVSACACSLVSRPALACIWTLLPSSCPRSCCCLNAAAFCRGNVGICCRSTALGERPFADALPYSCFICRSTPKGRT